MIEYRDVSLEELDMDLFSDFVRHQVVTKVKRKDKGEWIIKDEPFIDDWTENDFKILISCLKNTINTGGMLYAAFYNGKVKGFVSVESELFGGENKYLDLTSLHVSEDLRGMGIGRRLFQEAKRWAKLHGADKLYISSHSAVESQAFYKSMGCAEAKEYCRKHVEAEPFDCQLECKL